jgi:hypothetical protein
MKKRVKLITNETIIHSQIDRLESVIGRRNDFEITLNARGKQSNLQFFATEKEIEMIRTHTEYTILIQHGRHWLPLL